jgi:predicted transcriptional regulator
MTEIEQNKALLSLTAEIVSAHVKNNTVATGELPALIESVYTALRGAGQAASAPAQAQVQKEARAEQPERPAPFVSPKKSVFPDYIICLEDGRKLKTLKRHLRSTYNMTPEQYREKWDLPAEYPMVAPNYAEHRSALAKQLGLGRKPSTSAAATAPGDPTPPDVAANKTDPMPAAEVARPAPPARDPAPEPAREARTDHTAASVFAKFPRQAEEPTEPAPAPEAGARKSTRKPFSKQLARTMRP